MSRLLGILSVLLVVLVAMGFAAANAGHRVTVDLGLFTLYRVPVALVAFSSLFVGMLVMFGAGIYTDLKVRRILRERLSQESREEQTWIDRNQRDLFVEAPEEVKAPDRPSSRTRTRDVAPEPPLAEPPFPEPREEQAPPGASVPRAQDPASLSESSVPRSREPRTETETEEDPPS